MTRPPLVRYASSIVFTIAMLAVQMALATILGSESLFLVLFAAIILSAWAGGLGPGILAAILSTAWLLFDAATADGGYPKGEFVRLGIFFAQGLLVAYLLDALITTKRRLALARRQMESIHLELEQRVEERTAQMNSTIRELEAFSYTISHDMRAPLRAIDGFSQMLQDDYKDKLDAEGKRLIDIIRHNTQNMGRLIDGLLAFARLGRQQMGYVHLTMSEVVKDAIEEVRSPADGRNIEFRVAPLPDIDGDRVLLRQVLINLISNAVKFTRGRDPAVIEIGSRDERDHITYYVRDNGVGFESRYADKMFGVFQRLHAATEFEGTGLGLAIVQRIVQRHDGRVWAEGSPGAGATIYFSLPKPGVEDKRRQARRPPSDESVRVMDPP